MASRLVLFISFLCVYGSVRGEELSSKEPIPLIQIPNYVFKANDLYKKVNSVVQSEVCDVPYLTTLTIKNKNGSKTCSGAIINSTHILTVAQCVDKAISISVTIGINYRTKIKDDLPVKSWIKHPKYASKPKIKHDIAVVTLKRPIKFSKCIKPISLPTPNYARTTNVCMVSGWGILKGKKYYDTLHRAYIQSTSFKTCQQLVGRDRLSQFSCMGKSKNVKPGICLSDLGGPLTCIEPTGGEAILGGLSSEPFCEKNISLFVNVPFYRHWISRQLE